AGRRDQNVDAIFQFLPLFAVTNAAMHHGRAYIGETAVITKGRLDLRGQLAGWLQDQTTKFHVMSEQRQNRKREGGGFSGACLGGADQIFAGENNGESAQLDRRRFGKTHRLHAAHHFSGKIEILERHAWKLVPVARLVIPSAFVIPSEVACRAVALCEGWEESLTISLLKGKWRCLGFARHDKSAGHR